MHVIIHQSEKCNNIFCAVILKAHAALRATQDEGGCFQRPWVTEIVAQKNDSLVVGHDIGLQPYCSERKREFMMVARFLMRVLAACAVVGSGQVRAQESLVNYKSLSPAMALELAQAALANCQQRGFQVAVAVVDRSGVVQVVLRDRYAGPHTPATASGKAWTAATFHSSTSNLFAISQPGMMQAGIRNLPGAVIESGGSLVGAIGVSGAPGGDADEACAKAGIEAIQSKLDF